MGPETHLRVIAPSSITAISLDSVCIQGTYSHFVRIFCGEEKQDLPMKKILPKVLKIPVKEYRAVELRDELRALYAPYMEDPTNDPLAKTNI